MNCIQKYSLTCISVISAACVGTGNIYETSDSANLGATVVREGTEYTPVSRSPEGCLLYRVQIPSGKAPAALVYQSKEGRFSYGRPDSCIENTKEQ